MNRLSRVKLVAVRDVRERATSKAFRISTLLLVVFAMVGVSLPQFLGGPETVTAGLVGDVSPALRQAVVGALQPGAEVETEQFADRAAAEAALIEGDVDLAVGTQQVLVPDRGAVNNDRASAAARAAGLVVGLQQTGADPAAAAQALARPPLPIQPVEEAGATGSRYWLVYFAMLVLYLALAAYGSFIVNSVVEEKTSRVVEVVVSTVRPVELLTGKLFAMGVLAIGQLVVIGAPALTLATLTDQVTLPSGSVATFLAVLMWFVLGYAFYSALFAAAGSMATRTQDVQSVSMPVTFLLVLSFLAAFTALGSPDGSLARIFSFVPPTAPTAMLARSALGGAAVWEVVVSVAIMVVTTAATTMLAARIYRGSILQTGQRVSLARAWRGARA